MHASTRDPLKRHAHAHDHDQLLFQAHHTLTRESDMACQLRQ
jgi:hypothetical protein